MRRRRKGHYSGIGGQAVIEGVMMKNNNTYAVAVRKPNGEIEIDTEEYAGVIAGSFLKKIPFVRGVFNFIDSMILGMRTLTWSASFYEDEDVQETGLDKVTQKVFKDKAEKVLMGVTMMFSLALAVAIFMVLPYFLTNLFSSYVRNASLQAILEGAIRILIFVIYILSISLMKDIRRVYQYHGAEHKCINCLERGRPLTVKNVRRSSRQHKRCGTSFLLFVMFVSVVLFFFIRTDNLALRVAYRIVLIPVVAGISYEIIRLAGKSENILVRILSAPGMWLQRLTTKEPDDSMIEVAIASVEAVFDWKAYFKTEFGYDVDDSWLEDDKRGEGAADSSETEIEMEIEMQAAQMEKSQMQEEEPALQSEIRAERPMRTEPEPEARQEQGARRQKDRPARQGGRFRVLQQQPFDPVLEEKSEGQAEPASVKQSGPQRQSGASQRNADLRQSGASQRNADLQQSEALQENEAAQEQAPVQKDRPHPDSGAAGRRKMKSTRNIR